MVLFSGSPERTQAYERYIDAIAQAVNRFLREEDAFPVLIGMERLDARACRDLSKKLDVPCGVFLSEQEKADVISGVLRTLSWLVTSRYHAAVLSMAGAVPITAVSMDERLDGLLGELGLDAQHLHHVSDSGLSEAVYRSLCTSERRRGEIEQTIQRAYAAYREKLNHMGQFLWQYLPEG